MITDDNRLQIMDRRKFKQVEGELFAFKSNTHKMRLFCFRRGNTWYLTSGFAGKKEDDLPPGEVKRAREIMQACVRELDAYNARDRSNQHKSQK